MRQVRPVCTSMNDCTESPWKSATPYLATKQLQAAPRNFRMLCMDPLHRFIDGYRLRSSSRSGRAFLQRTVVVCPLTGDPPLMGWAAHGRGARFVS